MTVRKDHYSQTKLRKLWKARLEGSGAIPCGKCGQPVTPEMRWHVGHIIAHTDGGQATVDNTRVEHARCNESDGGKRGSAQTNAGRRPARHTRGKMKTYF